MPKVKLTLLEEMLGTSASDPEIHRKYIASLAPDANSTEEEVAALGVDEVVESGMTVFPRARDSKPFIWDYQIRGFFKDACSMLARLKDKSLSANLKAYKKVIDGLIFVKPRQIEINLPKNGKIGNCQRPLRADTAQGPRVALANSETVPAGSWMEFEVVLLDEAHAPLLCEWLDYGQLRGLGQWRNSGKGIFTYDILDESSKRRKRSPK